MKPNETIPPVQPGADAGEQDLPGRVLLTAGPEKLSFTFKYLLAFTPVILVFVCIIVRYVLDIIISTFFTVATSAISDATAFGGSGNHLLNVI